MGLLAVLVFCASIVAFFSEEFLRFFKKLFAIRGMLLVLPLVLVSGFVASYELEVLRFLLGLQAGLHHLMLQCVNYLPFKALAAFLIQVSCLFLIPTLFAYGSYGLVKHQHWGNATLWATRVYIFLWVFLIILWIA